MCAHTVSGPFRLTHPTPFKCAAGSSTHHVHAATVSFRWCSTLWTWFRYDFDGGSRCIIPSCFGRSLNSIEKQKFIFFFISNNKLKNICLIFLPMDRPSTVIDWKRHSFHHPACIHRCGNLANSLYRIHTTKVNK